ncbi:hypothetical protein Y717_08410 [Streptomyces scopuliridis RB72]|uniref:Uncharacterized protein n=1 Tax=Streptomyces scopuliridis RB72 TaxID=1440053 RepID=A0A2T7SQ50_9ACTN|nr:hypothetical protein Y717_08410 [Streptomyces scopuliridis RB72]
MATISFSAVGFMSRPFASVALIQALFRGRVVPEPQLEEMFTLPDPSVRDHVSGDPAAYSAGLSVKTLGGRQVWGKTGGRWAYHSSMVSPGSSAAGSRWCG